jgi:aspartate dehydrogenase
MSKEKKIGIIGYGYLGSSLNALLADTHIDVVRIYNRSEEKLKGLSETISTTQMEVFMEAAANLDLVIELAHPDVTKEWGEKILQLTDYMPCSVGALADEKLKKNLLLTGNKSGKRLLVPHGAAVGIDNIYEARENWEEVTITFRKPPGAIELEEEPEGEETILFEGPVREIAEKFPRNVNAMVACALASVGPDKAMARMIADRRLDNVLRGEFEFTGKDGSRLLITKEEPAVGVSSPGMVTSILGSVMRALHQSPEGIIFV